MHIFRGPEVTRGGWAAEGHLYSKVLVESPKITGFLEHQDSRTSEHHSPDIDGQRLPGAQGCPGQGTQGRANSSSLLKHFNQVGKIAVET